MGLTKYGFGELIELCFIRNSDGKYKEDSTIGVNIDKEIRVMRGDAASKDLKTFYVVKPDFFVYNPRGSRKLGLGYNDSNNTYITTFNNMVFRIKDEVREIVLPKYLFMYLSRQEWDRKVEFSSWGSSTEVFSWATFCETTVLLPSVSVQQKYIDVYNAMLANRRSYESGLEDLNTAISACIDEFKHTAPRVAVSTLLKEVDVRNSDGIITNVQGINIKKDFMPSVANLSDTDLSKYKVINKNQFAYSAMQTGRDECIRIALYHKDEPVIISPAYSVLQAKRDTALAEYIMLWFSRSESDRYGWFISDSSIRASLELARFYEIEIPLPSLEQQRAVVNFYNARHLIQRNIVTLGNMIKDLCPILIKGSLEETSA